MLFRSIFSTTTVGQSDNGIRANGVIPLTAALEAKLASGELGSLNEEVVGPYLKDQLRWRVRSVGSIGITI